jgi:hypothetical protein
LFILDEEHALNSQSYELRALLCGACSTIRIQLLIRNARVRTAAVTMALRFNRRLQMKRLLATLMLVALTSVAARGGDLVSAGRVTVACPTPNALDQVYAIMRDAARGRDVGFLERRIIELNCGPIRPKQDGPFEIKNSDGGYCELQVPRELDPFDLEFDAHHRAGWVVCDALVAE